MNYTWLAVSILMLSSIGSSSLLEASPIRTDISQQSKPATIKVLLTDQAEGAILEVKGRYEIYNPANHLPITSGVMSKRHAIYAHGQGIKWGDPFPYIHQMRIVPADAESSILINGIEYRGCIEIYNLRGTLSIVNEVDIENFLKSVFSAQMIERTDEKILDAIAIVARTNAYYLASRNPHAEWHVRAEEAQYYGYGITLQNLAIDRAIENTRHTVMLYNNQPFAATWNDDCAGRTATYTSIFRKQVRTTQGVSAPLAARDREKHSWTLSIPKQQLADMLGLKKIINVNVYLDQPSEKAYAIRFSDGVLSQDLDFFTLQTKLGPEKLRSNDFEVEIKGDKVVFSGWGTGHGVGLCLYSTNLLLQKGESLTKILGQFFPNTQLKHRRSMKEFVD